MRVIVGIVVLLCMYATSQAQGLQPVTWEFSAEKLDSLTYKINMQAKIQEPFHIYPTAASSSGGGLGLPTSISFVESDAYEMMGDLQERGLNAEKERTVAEYKKGAVFSQVVKLKQDRETKINFSIRFMACQGQMCLPPATRKGEILLPIRAE